MEEPATRGLNAEHILSQRTPSLAKVGQGDKITEHKRQKAVNHGFHGFHGFFPGGRHAGRQLQLLRSLCRPRTSCRNINSPPAGLPRRRPFPCGNGFGASMPQNTEGRPQDAFFSRQRKQVLESLKALEAADNPFLHTGVQAVTAGLKGDYRLRVGNLRALLTPERKKTSSSRLHNPATGKAY